MIDLILMILMGFHQVMPQNLRLQTFCNAPGHSLSSTSISLKFWHMIGFSKFAPTIDLSALRFKAFYIRSIWFRFGFYIFLPASIEISFSATRVLTSCFCLFTELKEIVINLGNNSALSLLGSVFHYHRDLITNLDGLILADNNLCKLSALKALPKMNLQLLDLRNNNASITSPPK